MRRALSAVSVVLFLMVSVLPALGVSKAKLGSRCAKEGTTVSVAGQKYKCTKDQNRLIWKKLPKAKADNTKKINNVVSPDTLASDPRITTTEFLTSLDICKTTDKTPEINNASAKPIFHNGFPRPEFYFQDKKSAKVLILPMIFADVGFSSSTPKGSAATAKSDLKTLQESIPNFVEITRKLSAGRFLIDFDIAKEDEWWVIPGVMPFFQAPQRNNYTDLRKLINAFPPKADFSSYDAVVFISGNEDTSHPGMRVGTAGMEINDNTFSSQKIKTPFGWGLITGNWRNSNLMFHELAHTLFGLEDLYIFGAQTWFRTRTAEETAPYLWDIMAEYSQTALLNWNRLLMGWIEDSEIRCVSDQKSSTHYLSNFENTLGSKLLLINLAPGVTIAADSVKVGPKQHLLLYTIDTYIDHGHGPIVTFNSTMVDGQVKNIYNWNFKVLKTSEQGVLVEVTQTDKLAYEPPKNWKDRVADFVERPKELEIERDLTVDLSNKFCEEVDQEVRNSFGHFKCQVRLDGRKYWSKNNI